MTVTKFQEALIDPCANCSTLAIINFFNQIDDVNSMQVVRPALISLKGDCSSLDDARFFMLYLSSAKSAFEAIKSTFEAISDLNEFKSAFKAISDFNESNDFDMKDFMFSFSTKPNRPASSKQRLNKN